MMDPVTLLLALAAGQILHRLTAAVASWLTWRGRAAFTRAAATLPPGVDLNETGPTGAGWRVRTTAAVLGRLR